MGPLRQATEQRIADLDDPDVALVALVKRLADIIDGDYGNASHVKEYRAAMRDPCPPVVRGPSLDDLEDD